MASNPHDFEATLHEILEAIKRNSIAAAASDVDTAPVCECVICSLVRESTLRSIKVLFAEFVNDIKARDSVRSARGFCGEHAKLVADLGDPLGVAILYADLADQARLRWGGEHRKSVHKLFQKSAKSLSGRSEPAQCPACFAAMEASCRYCSAMAKGLESAAVWSVFEDETLRSCGVQLCVVHTERLVDAAERESGRRFAGLQAAYLSGLQAELEEIIRKNDYQFRGEAWGPERDAWLRALKRINRD